MVNIDFNNIRPINGTKKDGFEEFICQLARKEQIEGAKTYVRNGKPDGGAEAYWILQDGRKILWQAKYFLTSFDNSQFQQINDSVKTAFLNYEGIDKYIIAIPIDIPDCHKPNIKSMRQRMDDYIQRWKTKYPEAEFEIWGQSELIQILQKPENHGLMRFWFDGNLFTQSEFAIHNNAAIQDLGVRYSPKVNVKLEIWEYFHIISRDNVFLDYFFNTLRSIEKICNTLEKNIHCIDLLETIKELRIHLNKFYSLNLECINDFPLNEHKQILYDFSDKISDVANSAIKDWEGGKDFQNKYLHIYNSINDQNIKILNIYNKLNENCFDLIQDPILILEGDAGVGKSHLLADVVSSLSQQKRCNLLFLGQKFTTNEDAISQLLKMVNFNGSFEEFLDILECQAQIQKQRLIIFIDALNEGQGLKIWPLCLHSLIDAIRRHKWLGLVLSVRSSYMDVLFPNDEYPYDFCVKACHRGFGTKFIEAVKIYFIYYNLVLPQIPILSPELSNPLFLRILCEGLKKNGVGLTKDKLDFSSILKFYLDGVEKSMREKKMYSSSLKVVPKALNKFITYIIENKRHEMPIDIAVDKIGSIYPNTFRDGELVEMLISEGVFSKNIFYDKDNLSYNECIYFSYERMENILLAQNILNKYKSREELINYFETNNPCGIRNNEIGFLEALAILLPETHNIELKDLFSYEDEENSTVIISAMIKSILWRKESTFTNDLLLYFERNITNTKTSFLFFEVLLQVSFIPRSKFNGFFLHKYLMSLKMCDRDAIWIPFLNQYGKYNNFLEDLIKWVFDESQNVEIIDDSILSGAVALSWIFASSNRKLRDRVSKSLVFMLTNRLHLIIPLLQLFEEVDDPYVYERILAAVLGCVVRSKDKKEVKNISLYLYDFIFNKDGEIYPHILVRDYARGVIEYAISIEEDLQIDVNKIRPPYQSAFDYENVSDKEIKDLLHSLYANDQSTLGLCNIITSMCTEFSNIFSYGDFGRYVFQSALSKWQVDPEELSKIAVKMIIDRYGYNEIKHGLFDKKIGSGRARHTIPNERIGKKYQWLALHELMARVSDNFKMIGYPWVEREIFYQGPWEPFIRDLDPTVLYYNKEIGSQDSQNNIWWSAPKYDNWDESIDEWLSDKKDLVKGKELIEITDNNGEKWLVLERNVAWEEPHDKDEAHKRYWNLVRSYIVDENDLDKLYDEISRKQMFRDQLPECRKFYQMFYREYYCSPAFEYFDKEIEGETITHRIIEVNDQNTVALDTTTICYLWESENDYSKSDTICWLMPSKQLFEGMNLQFSDKDGVFVDSDNKEILFEGASVSDCPSCLLVKKESLQEYLQNNKKRILWHIIGEKNIICLFKNDSKLSWLYTSGFYKLDPDGKITGKIRTSRKRW